jgi:hypothetical protein
MADSLARGQWMKSQLVRHGIPGDSWDSRVAALLVGSLLRNIPERSPGKLADEYAERLIARELTNKEAAELLLEFQQALEAYIQEQVDA